MFSRLDRKARPAPAGFNRRGFADMLVVCTMLIIDSHLDLSWNATGWNRDLTRSIAEIRRSESGMSEKGRGTNTVSLAEMRRAEVGVSLATVLARVNPAGRESIDFKTPEIAWAVAQGQLAWYRAECARGEMRQLRRWAEIESHLAEWSAGPEKCPVGFILAMEGADPVLNLDDLQAWYEAGLRFIGPVHYGAGIYAFGTGMEGGLTPRGRELVRAMQELGIVLDATHMAEQAFWEALELYEGPVLASHNNCRALVPGDRQFTDEQIRALVSRDAVIGAACDSWMLIPDWKEGRTPREAVGLAAVADHIDHICQIAGNTRHAAIGSDLDGGYGTEQCPHDLDTIADLQTLVPLLAARGYTAADIEAVMHGNWLRLFRSALS